MQRLTPSMSMEHGADINDQDIAVMRSSTWKATAGGDPTYIGGALIRMVAKTAAKEMIPPFEKEISIPSTLITQELLLENNVTNLSELDDALPAMKLPGFVSACWIQSLGGGEPPVDDAPSSDVAPVPTPVTTDPPSSGNMVSWLTVPVGMILIMSYLLNY